MFKTIAAFILAAAVPAAVLAQASAGAPPRAPATLFVDGNHTGVMSLDVASPAACAAIAAVVQSGQEDAVCVEPVKGWSVRNPSVSDWPAPVDRPAGVPAFMPVMLIDGASDAGFLLYNFDSYEACLAAGQNMGNAFFMVYCLDPNDGRAQKFK